MKLIIAGATGFVGRELISQSLRCPEITSVIALSRKLVTNLEDEANATKLKNIIVKDYDNYYTDEVRREFSGADACIWYFSPSPSSIPPSQNSMPNDWELT